MDGWTMPCSYRKQLQYQQLLQQQIDEKQRQKEKERREEEDRKRRELSEYQSTLQQATMRTQDERRESSYEEGYGDRGSQSTNRLRRVVGSSDDEDRDARRGERLVDKKPQRSIPPIKLRQGAYVDDDSDADYLENDNSARLYNQRMNAKSGGAHTSQQEEEGRLAERRRRGDQTREQVTSRRHADDSEDEPLIHRYNGRPPREKVVRTYIDDRHPGRDATKFVSIDEYDELSKLCDSLLVQQNQLKEELRSQAAVLKVRSRCSLL